MIDTLICKIDAHLRQLAPHIMERRSSVLLREAISELKDMRSTIAICCAALSEAQPCADERCKQTQTECIEIALKKANDYLSGARRRDHD